MPAKRKLTLGFCPIGAPGNGIGPFRDVFEVAQNIKNMGIQGCDAVVFWGGQDINPAIYGQKPHPTNQADLQISSRDQFEMQAMAYCKANNIPMIGVCRGAQLMCAVAGGTLVQHCTGHQTDHPITIEVMPNVLKTIRATSAHHQMMNPRGSDHKVIAWSTNRRSNYYQGQGVLDEIDEMLEEPEPEIVYFPELNGLAIQGHPEWVKQDDDFAVLCNNLIRQYLLNPVVESENA